MKTSYEQTNKKRLIALVVLAAVLVITLFSSCYVIKEADHDCNGAACPICAMIEQCEDNLRQIGSGQITIIAVVAAICCFFSAFYPAVSTVSIETLVTRKVRLNN